MGNADIRREWWEFENVDKRDGRWSGIKTNFAERIELLCM